MAEKLVNVISATVKELTEVPGIWVATADKIIKHREEVGPFRDIVVVVPCSDIQGMLTIDGIQPIAMG